MVMSGVFGISLKVVLLFCAQLNQSILTAEGLYIFVVCNCTPFRTCTMVSLSWLVEWRIECGSWFVAGGIPSGQVRFCREYLEAGSDGKDENVLADRHV